MDEKMLTPHILYNFLQNPQPTTYFYYFSDPPPTYFFPIPPPQDVKCNSPFMYIYCINAIINAILLS